MHGRKLVLLMIVNVIFLTPETGVTAEDYVLDTFGQNIEEKDLSIQLSSNQYPGTGVHLRSWDIRCTRWPEYDEYGNFIRYDYYLGALVADYYHEFFSVDIIWPGGTESMMYELYRDHEWNSGWVLISSYIPPVFPLYCSMLMETPSGQTDIFYGTVNSFGDLDQEPVVDLTSPPYTGSFRVQEHDFGEQVVLKSISINAGESWVVVGDMEIEIKLYGKETEGSDWFQIGVYTFEQGNEEFAIDTDTAVRMVKYGLSGTEGIKLSAPISDPTPDLYSVTLSTYKPLKVLLTFDDGPEGDEDKPREFNSTSSILSTLNTNSVQGGIKATFFTLTHGRQWGGSDFGSDLLCTEYASGHVVSIHQGGQGCKYWHTNNTHTKRIDGPAYPVGPYGEVLKKHEGDPVGSNRLESDLIAAIRRLRFLFGDPSYDPEFVRPPMYVYNNDVIAAYGSDAVKRELGNDVGFKMVLTDNRGIGDSGGPGPWPSVVSDMLKKSVKNCIQKGITEIVLTLHDSNDTTAKNLERYLNDIKEAAQEKGYVVEFVTSDSEARQILRNRCDAGNWQGS
jgi:peptidoglycan/xylan/chitin deacetylase (PgdA/CDA1 family)